MADYSKQDVFNPNKGFSRVKFGRDTSLLEIELDELQKIQQYRLESLVRGAFSNGFLNKSAMTISSGKVTLQPDTVYVNGKIIEILEPMTLNVSNNDVIYLSYWEQVVSYQDTIRKGGNLSGGTTMSNSDIFDSSPDINEETARRVQLQIQLTNSNLDNTKSYYRIGSISSLGALNDERVKYQALADIDPARILQNASNRFFTDTERTKLSGVSTGATKTTNHANNGSISIDGNEQVVYTHPSTHSLSMITETATQKIMTDTERTKLGGISTGANKTESSATNGNIKVDGVEKVVYTHPSSHPADMITETTTKKIMTDTERNKLAGISTGATKVESSTTNGNVKIDGVEAVVYTHPSTHSPSVIVQDANNRFFTDTERNKLSGISAGAEVNQNAFSNFLISGTTIASTGKSDTLEFVPSTGITLTPDVTTKKLTVAVAMSDTLHGNRGGGSLHALATAGAHGFMSSTDKSKLDGIEAGAQVNKVNSVNSKTGNVVLTSADVNALNLTSGGVVTGETTFNGGFKPLLGAMDSVLATDNLSTYKSGLTYYATGSDGDGFNIAPGIALTINDSTSRNFQLFHEKNTNKLRIRTWHDVNSAWTTWDELETVVGSQAKVNAHAGTGGSAHALVTTSVHGFMSSGDKSKLDGIANNANNYSHPTGDGNLHVPATGTGNSGKYLKAGATAGSLSWSGITLAETTDTQFGSITDKDILYYDGTKSKWTNGSLSAVGVTPASHIGSGGNQHAQVTQSVDGFMIASDKAKLDGISAGAQPNQNAFTTMKIGTVSAVADSVSDTFEFVAGTGISLVGDATNDKMTIAVTTHSHAISDVTGLQTALDGKSDSGHVHSVASQTVNGFMSSTDKAKLDGVANNANNYVHPTGDGNYHVPANGTTNNNKVLKSGATAGSYSWGNVAFSELTGVPTTLGGYGITDATPSSHVGSGGNAHANATTSVDGFMSAGDKSKLDGVAVNANNYSHPTGDGNQHVPATGTTNNGKFLKAGSTAGSLSWSGITWSDLTGQPTTIAGYGITDAVNSSDVVTVATANKLLKLDGSGLLPTGITGNSATTTKLATARTISLGTDASGSVNFDGSGNITIPVTLASVGTAGTYTKVTTDAKGRVTSGTTLSAGDIPGLDWSKITSGVPSTLAGFGIGDATIRGTATIKGATWSRIIQLSNGSTIGHSFILNVRSTRASVVNNATFTVTMTHNNSCQIIQIGNTGYGSVLQLRGVVDTNGDGWIEMYDVQGGFTSASTQPVYVVVSKLVDTTISILNTFTDGSTVPSTHSATGNITTVPGNYVVANLKGDVSGNSNTANQLINSRGFSISGDVTAPSISFDGTGNVALVSTLASVGTAGTYTKVTTDAKGRVTSGTTLVASDIPNLDWSKITSGKPTTYSGYGITDVAPSSHVGATGSAHGVATTSVNGFMASTDKSKLDGISSGATKTINHANNGSISVDGVEQVVYTHPATHSASMINGLTVNRALVSDASGVLSASAVTSTELGYLSGVTSAIQTQLNGKASTSVATTGANGLMSSTDKGKLDGISAGAEVNQNSFANVKAGATTINSVSKSDTLNVTAGTGISVTGNNSTNTMTIAVSMDDTLHGARGGGSLHSVATSGAHGFMSNTDKAKLDGMKQSISATLPATIGWYRIAQSTVDIGRNFGRFEIDWTLGGIHGQAVINAGVMYGATGSTALNQVFYSNYAGQGVNGLTKARIVYHTTYAGNYAYVEVYNGTASAISVNVDLLGSMGWSLVSPSTAGSVPAGYTTDEITFANGIATSDQLVSQVPQGTAPLVVSSTTQVANLNASYVGGVALSGLVQTSRNIAVGTGLIGGGDLSANRSISFDTSWGDNRYMLSSASSNFAPSGYGLGTAAVLLANGTDLNTIKTTGFYRVNAGLNVPPRVTGDNSSIWHYVQVIQHDNSWIVQNAWEYNTGTMFTRVAVTSGAWGSWRKVWTEANTGTGSGLDADTLDGNHASAFSLTTHTHKLGDLSNAVESTLASGDILRYDGANWRNTTVAGAGIALSSRSISAGSGLTGGGDLTANRTLSVSFGGTGSATTVSRSDHNHDTSYVASDNSTKKTLLQRLYTGTLTVPAGGSVSATLTFPTAYSSGMYVVDSMFSSTAGGVSGVSQGFDSLTTTGVKVWLYNQASAVRYVVVHVLVVGDI